MEVRREKREKKVTGGTAKVKLLRVMRFTEEKQGQSVR